MTKISGKEGFTDKNNSLNYCIEKRLFLHFLELNNQREKFVVDQALTQKGIQKILDCDIGYLSRLLKQNEIQGFIFRRKVHVYDGNKKQYAFFLTDKGNKLALEFIQR